MTGNGNSRSMVLPLMIFSSAEIPGRGFPRPGSTRSSENRLPVTADQQGNPVFVSAVPFGGVLVVIYTGGNDDNVRFGQGWPAAQHQFLKVMAAYHKPAVQPERSIKLGPVYPHQAPVQRGNGTGFAFGGADVVVKSRITCGWMESKKRSMNRFP